MEPPTLAQLLSASLDGARQREVTEGLEYLKAANLGSFLSGLVDVVNNPQAPPPIVKLAVLTLKNTVTSKTDELKLKLADQWRAQPDQTKNGVRSGVLRALGHPDREVRRMAAIAVGTFAGVDLRMNQWTEVVPYLANACKAEATTMEVRESALTALGYVCQEAHNVLQGESPRILEAISTGLAEHATNQVKLAATVALANSMVFVSDVWKMDKLRDQIMAMVFAVCESPDVQIRVAAFQCLVEIALLYYPYLGSYMEPVFDATSKAIKAAIADPALDEVGRRAIEFWSSVAEVEGEILDEKAAALKDGRKPLREGKGFIQRALGPIVGMLLGCLSRQAEEYEDDTPTVARSAGVCLVNCARVGGNGILTLVLPFIKQFIHSESWRHREAAITAFGAVLVGPEPAAVEGLAKEVMGIMLSKMDDDVVHVRDTAAWTVGRICDACPKAITEQTIESLMQHLVKALADEPAIARHACWALHNLAVLAPVHGAAVPTSPLSPWFKQLVTALLKAARRDDANTGNLIVPASETINQLILGSALDVQGDVCGLAPHIIDTLRNTMRSVPTDQESRLQQETALAMLVSTLGAIIQRLEPPQIREHMASLVPLFLELLAKQPVKVQEEVFLAISPLALKLGAEFNTLLDQFRVPLLAALRNLDEHVLCQIAVGVVADAAAALGPEIQRACDDFVASLVNALRATSLERNVKVHVIMCIGDVALAIGGGFERYISQVMNILVSASRQTLPQPANAAAVDFLNALRLALFEAYSSIMNGLKQGNKQALFARYIGPVVAFINLLGSDANTSIDVIHAAVQAIGDACDCLQGDRENIGAARPLIKSSPVSALFEKAHRISANDEQLRMLVTTVAAAVGKL